MLDDALLMIGIYVLNDEQLIEMANRFTKKREERYAITLYDDIDPSHLKKMYAVSRAIAKGHKVILSILDGSSVHHHIHVLEGYPFEVEVSKTILQKGIQSVDQEN